MESVPKTCNWVKARAACSLEHMFLLLSEVVDSDVKAMQEHARQDTTIMLNKVAVDKFVVAKQWNLGGGFISGESVGFGLNNPEQEIVVRRLGPRLDEVLFTAKPSLDQQGECRFQIKGDAAPSELWQVSRRALEGLFFGR